MLFNHKEEAMHKQRIAVMVAALLGIIATFLPWATVAGVTITGSQVTYITLGLCAIALILALLGDRSQPVASGMRIGIAVLGLLTGAYGAYQIMDMNKAVDRMAGMEGGAEIASGAAVGIGLYLVIAAGFLLLILPFMLGSRDAVTPVATSPA
jgi:uncharacterized membrane protein YuzA (DUF378 family)